MKPELQAKFLQHLNRKKDDQGFTLIELLVVIIIIGILAAIALPTFLNQTAKGKQSEAKNTLSAINKAQVAFRTEAQSFAASIASLSLGLPTQTNNYIYNVASGIDTATVTGQARDTSLKAYSGGSTRYIDANSNSAIASILCEAKSPGTGAPVAPTLTSTSTTVGGASDCVGTYKEL